MGERRGPGTFQMGRAAGDPMADAKVKTVPVNLLNRHTKRVLGRPEGWDTSEVGRLRHLEQGRASKYNARRGARQQEEPSPSSQASHFELPPGSLLLKSPHKPSIARSGGGPGTAAGSTTASSSLGYGRGEDEGADEISEDGSRALDRRAVTQHYRALLLGEDFDDWGSAGASNKDRAGSPSRPMLGATSRRGRAEDFLRPAQPPRKENKLLSKYKANIVPRGMKRPPHTYLTDVGPPSQQQQLQQQPEDQTQGSQRSQGPGQDEDAAAREWESHLRAPTTADFTARYFQFGDEDKPKSSSSKASSDPRHPSKSSTSNKRDHPQQQQQQQQQSREDPLPPPYHEQHRPRTGESHGQTREPELSQSVRSEGMDDQSQQPGLPQHEEGESDRPHEGDEDSEAAARAAAMDEALRHVDEEEYHEDDEDDEDAPESGDNEADEDENSEEEEDEDEGDEGDSMGQQTGRSAPQPAGDAQLSAKYLEIISQLTGELERAQDRIADMERQREDEQEELEQELDELDKGNLDLKGQTVALQRQVLRLTAERQENLETIREQQDANAKLRADYTKMEEIAKVLHQKATVLQKKLAEKDGRSVERAAERKVRGLAGGSQFPVETLEDAMDRIAELESLNEALRTGFSQSRAASN